MQGRNGNVKNAVSTSMFNTKKITLKHLISLYGEEQGLALFKANERNLFAFHGLAWALGKQSLHYFCEVFLHKLLFDYDNGNVPLSETHYKIWDELQDIILNHNNTRNVYVYPRGFGKSTTITIPVAIWCAMYCIHPFTVIDSSSDDQSAKFVETIKTVIEDNALLKSAFGEFINKNLKYNSTEIEFDIKPNRSKIQAVGSMSSVRGINYNSKRIGLLLLDDAQDEKQISTDASRDKFVDLIQSGILKALQNNDNHVIAVGTVRFKHDLYDTFIHSPGWIAKAQKCIQLEDIDRYFEENEHWQNVFKILRGKNINPTAQFDAENYYIEHKKEMDFPVIWNNYDCFALACEYIGNVVAFKREFQCDIENLGVKRIKSISALPRRVIEQMPFGKTILSVDPASTTNKRSDYSAFCVLSENDENNLKYARRMISQKMEFEEYINTVIALLKEFTDIKLLSIEKQVYSGADVIKIRERIMLDQELCQRPLQILNKARPSNQSKDSRIDTIIPDINMGRIIFCEEDAEEIEQIAEFAGCKFTAHDDMIDALTDAMENIGTIKDDIPTVSFFPFSLLGL